MSTFLNKSILIIKAWWMYQGRILGSNIGWIATYTLEVLIIHILIAYPQEWQTPLDVYFKFFEIYGEVNWDEDLMTIYGLIKIDDIVSGAIPLDQAIHDKIYTESDQIKNNNLVRMVENLERHQKEYRSLSKEYNPKWVKSLNTPLNYPINVLDPLTSTNNLGKSISTFNSKRIKRIIKRQNDKYFSLKQK